MPFYTDPTLYSSPIPSYALYLSGPYSNHSSLIGASYTRPSAYSKPISRFHRGYAPHLATISENQVNSTLRRNYSPHLPVLHSSSQKYRVPRPIRINTADIDVSADRYKARLPPQLITRKISPRDNKRDISKSPSPKPDDGEFTTRPIRRDRATVRLHTIHKGDVKAEVKSKKEDEPSKKEITQKKNEESNGLQKIPSFHDICRAILHDNINEQLNPGQPEDITRKQSRTFSNEDLLKQIRRNSAEILKENLVALENILDEDKKAKKDETALKEEITAEEKIDGRSSIKRKKKAVRKKTYEGLVSDDEVKSPLHRRHTKKYKRTSTDSSVQSEASENIDKEREEIIRDISKVEIEEIKKKPKPLISGIVNVETTIKSKPNLKLIVDDVKVEEVVSPKTPKKFKFNVTVNVEDNISEKALETAKVNKVIPPRSKITDENKGKVHIPKAKDALISDIRQNNKQRGSICDIYDNIEEVPKKINKKTDSQENNGRLNDGNEVTELEEMKLKSEEGNVEDICQTVTPTTKNEKLNENNNISDAPSITKKVAESITLIKDEHKKELNKIKFSAENQVQTMINSKCNVDKIEDKILPTTKEEIKSHSLQNSTIDKLGNNTDTSLISSNTATDIEVHETIKSPKEENKGAPILNSITQLKDDTENLQSINVNSRTAAISTAIDKILPSPKEEDESPTLQNSTINKFKNNVENLTTKSEEKLSDSKKGEPKTQLQEAQKKYFIDPKKKENDSENMVLKKNIKAGDTIYKNPTLKIGTESSAIKTISTPTPTAEEEDFWSLLGTRGSVYVSPNSVSKKKIGDIANVDKNQKDVEKPSEEGVLQKKLINNENKTKLDESASKKQTDKTEVLDDKKEKLGSVVSDAQNEQVAPVKTNMDNTSVATDRNINTDKKEEIVTKKMPSKGSLVNKATVDDPDLVDFAEPEPEPQPEPEPEPEPPASGFVPLQSNRFSQFMHPFKKPEQFDECPVEIFATPKTIRKRHYPRPRNPPPLPQPIQESDSNSDEEETSDETDTTSEEETSSADEGNVGKSTSSNDSGFNSSNGSPAMHRNKGSSDTRDSPTSNPCHNPAFALDPGDSLEELYTSSTYACFQKSGRITPPATTIPRFRKYTIEDFNFLKVLGKGSFGKVLLAELKDTEYYYAIKCLKKDVVLEDDDVECTLIERKVLALGTKHPYLCHLLCTFQTESHLFFVMEYLNGGDLMFHIQTSGRFVEPRACVYAAEIVSGLKFLHSKGIVYRDLKLDNILLDFDGHVRIADFGMCKLQIFLDRTADTFCGTPDYMAPEIIKGLHYNQNVDWWSFGVLLYEMLIGQSPFSGCDEDELFWSICNEKPVFPRFLSAEALSILKQLLEKDANKRLGNKFSPHGEIQDHAFFRPISWDLLERRQLEAPFKPNLQHPLDTQYFDRTFTVEKAKLTPIDKNILQSMDQTQFQGFSYTNPNATDR